PVAADMKRVESRGDLDGTGRGERSRSTHGKRDSTPIRRRRTMSALASSDKLALVAIQPLPPKDESTSDEESYNSEDDLNNTMVALGFGGCQRDADGHVELHVNGHTHQPSLIVSPRGQRPMAIS